jgi:hypothetical protein
VVCSHYLITPKVWLTQIGKVLAAAGKLRPQAGKVKPFALGSVILSIGMAPVFTLTTDLIIRSAPPERDGAALRCRKRARSSAAHALFAAVKLRHAESDAIS